jgi:flagellar biogenesis protein FliO
MSQTLLFFFAFLFGLALIGVAAWLVRRFAGGNLNSSANRGRMPRMALIEAADIDGRRKLMLVRRDNVEHLLMIGGPTDVVIESNIVRATPQRDPALQRAPAGTELPARMPPLPDAPQWTESEIARSEAPTIPDIIPEPAPRGPRLPLGDDMRRPGPPLADRRTSDPFTGPPPAPVRQEPMVRTERAERALPRSERIESLTPRAPRPGEPPSRGPAAFRPSRPAEPISTADQNLAEMAQRLEAALRRPSGEPRPEGGEARAPSAGPMVGAPPVAPESSASRPVPRGPDITSPEKPPPAESPASSAAPAPKAPFENLEDEMASLLGRAKNPP